MRDAQTSIPPAPYGQTVLVLLIEAFAFVYVPRGTGEVGPKTTGLFRTPRIYRDHNSPRFSATVELFGCLTAAAGQFYFQTSLRTTETMMFATATRKTSQICQLFAVASRASSLAFL